MVIKNGLCDECGKDSVTGWVPCAGMHGKQLCPECAAVVSKMDAVDLRLMMQEACMRENSASEVARSLVAVHH
jgi:hypothetical protein